jgi:DNA-binding NarL/FixJ family response regulator
MKTTRILIVDDHSVVRRGLRMLIANHEGWTLCGEASTAAEALEKVGALKPDLVVMDLSVPGIEVLEAIREIKDIDPDIGILMHTTHDSREMIDAAVQAGAGAYVLKSDAESDLIAALEAVSGKREFFSPGISKAVLESDVQRTRNNASHQRSEIPDELTQRQLDVLNLLVRGQNNKQVASALGISPRTVEAHRNQIMTRLNIRTLSELVLYALRNSLLRP